MLTAQLAFAAAFNLAAAGVCLAIGARLVRHRVEGPAQRAATLFSIWWLALGIDVIINNVTWLVVPLGFESPALIAALTYAAVLCVTVMIWGLVYYLAYLFTGRAGLFWPLTAFYAASFIGALAFIVSLRPDHATVGRWGGAVGYANEPAPIAGLLFAVFYLLPPILGSLAYGTLVVRVRDRFRRFRIALVSASLFVWLSSSLVAAAMGSSDTGQFVSWGIASAALAGLIVAYFPPAALRRRLDVAPDATLHAVHEGLADAQLVARTDRALRQEEFIARARELI